jgi:hypothetical protein
MLPPAPREFLARSEAATSIAMKLAPITTDRPDARALETKARLSASFTSAFIFIECNHSRVEKDLNNLVLLVKF